jgi:subtilisin family serine protease
MQLRACRIGTLYCIAFIASLAFGSIAVGSADTGLGWLDQVGSSAGELHEVVVFFDNETLRSTVQAASATPDLTREQRISKVSKQLRSYRPNNHNAVREFVIARSTSEIAEFWIVPSMFATLSGDDIRTLSAMTGVQRIVPNLIVELIEPVETKEAESSAASTSVHQQMLNLPYLWNLGITGVGRLVCSFDTGVESDHPALTGNWRGNHAPLSASWFSTISPDLLPYDKSDHGTHTMGTVCGFAGSDTIGVAPGAEWITAGVIDQGKSLTGTFADILAAFQWVLNPDGDSTTFDDVPDVILNSWGVPATLFDPCDETFFAAIDNVEAAGIVCVFAAGNEGPNASTLRNPASRATSPLNSFSVGAVDNNKVVADFSSRGPGGCGLGAIKPEVVAPGVAIRSASSAGGYKTMTGTSMAAPFVAGMVALCRQYNPNSTVEEIKWAIINSAEDLGTPGEDNAYGYGLPDGSRILDYLSDPETPHFRLAAVSIEGDGVAMPGESFDLRLTVTRTTGSVERVAGLLGAHVADDILIPGDSADFVFGTAGTTALATQAYRVNFGDLLLNGSTVDLSLVLRDGTGAVYDTLTVTLPVGYEPVGTIASQAAGLLELTVSDFGQYGLAPGSIYNVGGQGLRWDGSENLLFESGLIVGRNALQLSSSVRGADGAFTPSDFVPVESLSEEWTDEDLAVHRSAVMADDLADVTIPVQISQQSSYYAGDDIVIMRYRLVNTDLATLSNLYFGFLADFDLPGTSETVTYDLDQTLVTQAGTEGPSVGLVALNWLTGLKVVSNGDSKAGFTAADKFDLISSPTNIQANLGLDLMVLLTGGPFTIAPGDSVEIALAILGGSNQQSVAQLAGRARDLYLIPTSVNNSDDILPSGYLLSQNYPNPFNPTTTIGFELPVSSEVTMEIFNLLGQQVRQLHSGRLSAGSHTMIWDARNESGQEVASGVYLYRLSTPEYTQARKMVLLR